MIEAHGISVRAGKRYLLADCSLRIVPGRVTALLGPNGAGKSTAISVLSGERKPDGGHMTIDGQVMTRMSAVELARRRAVLLQNASLDFGFTVGEVVGLGRLPFAMTRDALADEEALATVRRVAGIEALWDQTYHTLSGGERQRVQYTRALAQIWRRSPDAPQRYLFLDEPTSALDLHHRRAVLTSMRALAVQGVGILVVLHDLNLAVDFADDVVLLRDGRVLAQGPVEQVLTPDHLSVCFDVPVEIIARDNGRPVILA